MKDLSITERRNKDVLILDLAGRVLIGETTSKLRSTLRSHLDQKERNLILNLAEVTHIDSSGLGDIVAGHVSFEKAGGALKLLNLTDKVNDLMMITKLLTVFETFSVEDDAV
ncbi:MAG: STAS domain-containing protein, partial [Acidobacteriota bacterium]|nr:STAS domain-containing protein [Acidobacteriota bacterium]